MNLTGKLISLNLIRLRRRLCLLVAIAAVFVSLAFTLALGAESMLVRDSGVSFLRLAVIGSGDENEELVRFAGGMSDLESYCSFVAMEYDEAMTALQKSEVTAVLELPENFVNSILSGENKSAVLHLDASKPAESMLTLYVGQCAADMLSAAQGGIYAVLDQLVIDGIVRENAIFEINLEYIKFTLSRGNMYVSELASATGGTLSIGTHYVRTLLSWLILMSSVIFYPVLSPVQNAWRKRLSAIACTGAQWSVAAIAAVTVCLLPLVIGLCAISGELSVGGVMSLLLFSAGFAALFGALSRTESLCSGLCFTLSGVMAFLAGGIIPPVLLPNAVKPIMPYSPITMMRSALGGEFSVGLFCLGVALLSASFFVLCRGFEKGESV